MVLITVNSFLVLIAILLSPHVASAYLVEGIPGDGFPDFVYDSTTGGIWVDPDGQSFDLFYIISDSGIFTGEPTIFPPGGFFVTDSDHEIGAAYISSRFTEPEYLGAVAIPGLTLDFLSQDFTTAYISYSFASGPGRAGLRVIRSPEPSSLNLFGLGLLGLLSSIRRREWQ